MWFQIARDVIIYLFSGCCNSAKKAQNLILLNVGLQRVYLGVSLGEYQLLSNYPEFSNYGYCVIHDANYTFYVTNTYLTGYCNLIGSTTIVVVAQVPYTTVTRPLL